MNDKRFDDLEKVLEHIWAYAEKGSRVRDNAMATPAFATAGPGLRTVVLRSIDRDQRALAFHTDVRAKKVQEIESNPRVIWMGWDKNINQQFQFKGEATVHRDDEIADEMWESESGDELVFYYKKVEPASVLPEPESGMDIFEVEEEEARKNFGVVRTVVDEIIWQHLHPEGEYRARFVWKDGRFQGEWIVP